MQAVWGKVQGSIMSNPEARIAERVEARQY
jgi:hypothetical protein